MTEEKPLSERRSDVVEWADYGQYMREKKRKLRDQFVEGGRDRSTIFEGVSIYVNGWTDPDADRLRKMVREHGGNYEFNLYPGSRATHVIATNLPDAKIKTLGSSVVCTPQWIVDSIAEGRLLPVLNYRLYGALKGQRQLQFHSSTVAKEGASLTTDPTHPARSEGLKEEEWDHGTRDAHAAEEDIAFSSPGVFDGSPQSSPTSTTTHSTISKAANAINQFYTHSRLHHLSTWGGEMKRFASQLLARTTPMYNRLPAGKSLGSRGQRAVVHIDLDCFFASASVLDKPDLRGKPVAVTHATRRQEPEEAATARAEGASSITDSLRHSMSDIASCNYEARKLGIRNGMQLGEALSLCPDLSLVPYDFDKYRSVSKAFYEVLVQCCSSIEPVSCDEAYLELSDCVESLEEVLSIVEELRGRVLGTTGCPASAGISHNMLLARLATRVAKPNGQFLLPPEEAQSFLSSLPVSHLPGVGHVTTSRLGELGVTTCGELRALPLSTLRSEFGPRTGQALHDGCRGEDGRPLRLNTERKSLSADVNFGIRFSEGAEVETFLKSLAEEVERRACEAGVLAGSVTLKLMVRRPEAPLQTRKYMGHGSCDTVTRSCLLLQPTRAAGEIGRLCVRLLKQVVVEATDVRGVGIQLTKLVTSDATSGSNLKSYFKVQQDGVQKAEKCVQGPLPPLPKLAIQPVQDVLFAKSQVMSSHKHQVPPHDGRGASPALLDLPSSSQLEPSVLCELPQSIQEEIRWSMQMKAVCPKAPFPEQDQQEMRRASSLSLEADGVVVDDEEQCLSHLRGYLRDWVGHFRDGPEDGDVRAVADYLATLLKDQLELVFVTLKYLERLVARTRVQKWFSAFNVILSTIQAHVLLHFGGRTSIQPII